MPPAAARQDFLADSIPSQVDVVLACLAERRTSIPASHETPTHRVNSSQNIAYGRVVLRSVAHTEAHERSRSASLNAVAQAKGSGSALRRQVSRQSLVHEPIGKTLYVPSL